MDGLALPITKQVVYTTLYFKKSGLHHTVMQGVSDETQLAVVVFVDAWLFPATGTTITPFVNPNCLDLIITQLSGTKHTFAL
jgi:hypothetical protein